MLETPQVLKTAVQLTAFVHLTVPRAQIRTVMGPGLNEVREAIASQRIAVTGPWFTHHLRMPSDVFDFEICLPVAAPVVAVGRVKPGQVPAMTVARTIYRGPYEGLADAWGEFNAWVAAQGHRAAAELWECYVVGPEADPDSANWRTELSRPLIS